MTENEKLEQEARRLREAIYGKQTQNNCKDNWVDDIEWLRRNAPKKI